MYLIKLVILPANDKNKNYLLFLKLKLKIHVIKNFILIRITTCSASAVYWSRKLITKNESIKDLEQLYNFLRKLFQFKTE